MYEKKNLTDGLFISDLSDHNGVLWLFEVLGKNCEANNNTTIE